MSGTEVEDGVSDGVAEFETVALGDCEMEGVVEGDEVGLGVDVTEMVPEPEAVGVVLGFETHVFELFTK